ncbi:hypothetical protein LEMLEM_LOCUS5599 [Lemmus lemmus]
MNIVQTPSVAQIGILVELLEVWLSRLLWAVLLCWTTSTIVLHYLLSLWPR